MLYSKFICNPRNLLKFFKNRISNLKNSLSDRLFEKSDGTEDCRPPDLTEMLSRENLNAGLEDDFSAFLKSGSVKMVKHPSGDFKYSVTVSKPDGCSNPELVERYNELKYVLLSPRLLGQYVSDLNSEFINRFGKTPFNFDRLNRIISWERKIYYNSVLDTFEFFELN